LKPLELAHEIAKRVAQEGGRAYFVGGFVRDGLLNNIGTEVDFGTDFLMHKCIDADTDIDIEVHGLEPEVLEKILDSVGERIEIGKSFGIYALKGYSIDIAMPRREKNVGKGHKAFDVEVDPYIGLEKAAIRRDFTINALMADILSGEVIDLFGGLDDLRSKVLKHVDDDTFKEDPLRVLRAAQFAARFKFLLAPETVKLCKSMDVSYLSPERVMGELKKALLKAEKPSIFFEILRETEQLDVWFLEVKALIGVEQNPKFHPEGDVWIHTMKVLDDAVQYRDKVKEPFAFMLSAVAHDFGKPRTTEVKDGVIHAYNHEEEGLREAQSFMERLTNEKSLIEYVLNMVRLHMKPNIIANANSAIKSSNKMFDESKDPEALIYLSIADAMPGASSAKDFLFQRLAVYREYMARPYVMGRDLIESGIEPSEKFSELLEYAHKLRLAGIKKEEALKQVISKNYSKESKKK